MESTHLDNLIDILEDRFRKNMSRHSGIPWSLVQVKLEAEPEELTVLSEMENTGGEPDVIGYDTNTKEYIMCECSHEGLIGRRSFCYDQEALESRKANKLD